MTAAITIRKATAADLPEALQIIQAAKAYLHQQKIDQWQGVYPDLSALAQDQKAGVSRLLLCSGEIAGYAALISGPDPDYEAVTTWLRPGKYMVIHRLALAPSFRGQKLSVPFMQALVAEAKSLGCLDVRADTHPQNLAMQHVLLASGFHRVGQMDHPKDVIGFCQAFERRLDE